MTVSPGFSQTSRRVAGFVSASVLALLFVACGVRTVPPANPNQNPDPRLAQADKDKQADDGKKPGDGKKPDEDGKKPSDGGKKTDGKKQPDDGRGFAPPDAEPVKDKDKAEDKDGGPKVRPNDGKALRLAVLVGLDGYDSKDFSDLRYAEKDVEELGKLLVKAGYDKDDVVVLTGQRGEADGSRRPTVANVRKALAAATKRMGERDVLVVALAGHGIEPAKGEHSYCTYRAKKLGEGKFSGLLPISEVYEQLGKAKGALKLLLVDACRNDPNSRGLAEIDGGFETVTAPPPSRNTIAFYSCSPGERSWEPGELKHGLFMYHFLQGLRERADYFQDGKITWQNVVSFTDREVRSYSRNQLRKPQQPHFKGEARGEVPPLAVWEGKAPEQKKPATEEEKKAFGFLQINEDFMRASLAGRPRGWEGRDQRVATDKQNRRCLEAVGETGMKEITLPKVNLTGDFFIEIEYLLDGYNESPGHEMVVIMEGREGADRVRASVDHGGRSIVGNTDKRKPAKYVVNGTDKTRGPYKVTRFRLEREGRVYRVLLNDEFACGGEQSFGGAFDTVKLQLSAGIPYYHSINDVARIYSVKVGTMQVPQAADNEKPIPAPDRGKPYVVDFRTAKLAGLPPGWVGPDFYVATDKESRRCLEARGEKGAKPLVLPRFTLKGDFFVEIECVLDGYGTDENRHQLEVLFLGRNGSRIPFKIDHAGRATILSSDARVPAKFKPFGVSRVRIEREGNVYRASINDVPAVGLRINYTDDVEAIQLGLTAGVPYYHTLNQRARIYAVKVATGKAERAKDGKPEYPAGGVKEDFRWYRPGELPEGWQASRLGNVSIQPGAQLQGLELISKGDPRLLSDAVGLPTLDLPGTFVGSFECELPSKESVVGLTLAGQKPGTGFQIVITGEKKLSATTGAATKPVDVAKMWKKDGPQFVQFERTANGYKVKLNDEEVVAVPLGKGGVPLVGGALTLKVKEKGDATPRVTSLRLSPLK